MVILDHNDTFTSLLALQNQDLLVALSVLSNPQRVHRKSDHSYKRKCNQNKLRYKVVIMNIIKGGRVPLTGHKNLVVQTVFVFSDKKTAVWDEVYSVLGCL